MNRGTLTDDCNGVESRGCQESRRVTSIANELSIVKDNDRR